MIILNRLTSRQQKALETKNKILNTALRLFSERGFDQVTIDDIAFESGTSKGAFYVHFQSKYDVFWEKFNEIDDFYEEFIRSLPKLLSFHEKMEHLFVNQMIYLQDSLGKDLMRTIYISGLIPSTNNYFSTTSRKLYQIINNLVTDAIATGEINEQHCPLQITKLITRCMRGTLYDWQIFEEDFNLVEESRNYIRIFLNGLR